MQFFTSHLTAELRQCTILFNFQSQVNWLQPLIKLSLFRINSMYYKYSLCHCTVHMQWLELCFAKTLLEEVKPLYFIEDDDADDFTEILYHERVICTPCIWTSRTTLKTLALQPPSHHQKRLVFHSENTAKMELFWPTVLAWPFCYCSRTFLSQHPARSPQLYWNRPCTLHISHNLHRLQEKVKKIIKKYIIAEVSFFTHLDWYAWYINNNKIDNSLII